MTDWAANEVRPGFASTAFNADKAKAVLIPKAEVNLDETIQHPKKQEFKKNVMSDVMFTVWSCVTKAEKQT